MIPHGQGFLKVAFRCHYEAFYAEAIPIYGDEIASTGQERRPRNDTEQEVTTLRKAWPHCPGLSKVLSDNFALSLILIFLPQSALRCHRS